MIHHGLLNQIRKRRRWDDFIHPDYGSLSIAEIGPTIWKIFGIESERHTLAIDELSQGIAKDKKVLMFLIDGLAYRHFIKAHKNLEFFKRLAVKGNTYPITSVFPSTTPAALTTIHTGLTPQEHGLPEWTVYFEEFDSIIETLPFKTWGMKQPDGLLSEGGASHMLYGGETVYEKLQKNGVKSYMFIYHAYAHSVYSDSVHRGSILVPFVDGLDLMNQLREKIVSEPGPAYFFVYWGYIDSYAHEYGPDSPEHVSKIHEFSELVTHEFLDKLKPEEVEDVLFMMTADHGHSNIKGEEIINLNQYPEIDKNLAKSVNGKRILPTGSPHDVFLFIEDDKRDEVISFLRNELSGQAAVLKIEEAIELGLFGLNKPTATFLRRIGNTIILPYNHYHVWYEFFPDMPYNFLGIHGGLSEEEMIVPLTLAKLKALVGEPSSDAT